MRITDRMTSNELGPNPLGKIANRPAMFFNDFKDLRKLDLTRAELGSKRQVRLATLRRGSSPHGSHGYHGRRKEGVGQKRNGKVDSSRTPDGYSLTRLRHSYVNMSSP